MALAQVTSTMFSTAEIHILFEGQKTRFTYPGISWKKRHQFFRLFLLQVSLTEKCVWKDTNDHTANLSVFSHVVYCFGFFFQWWAISLIFLKELLIKANLSSLLMLPIVM